MVDRIQENKHYRMQKKKKRSDTEYQRFQGQKFERWNQF